MTESISVTFTADYETHNRKKFQEEGHMLFPLRYRNAEGDPVFGPCPGERKWQGEEVHILKLSLPSDPNVTILRVMSDSLEDAKRMIADGLPRVLFGLQTAETIRQQQVTDSERLQREHSNLLVFCGERFTEAEIDQALSGAGQ